MTGKRIKRIFTAEEDTIIKADYRAYISTIEIARKLGRDEGTLRQHIYRLKLKRSNSVSVVMAWAPEHIRARLTELSAEQFLTECYAWRDEQNALSTKSVSDEKEKNREHLAALCAEIDQRADISRNAKMVAKRMAGMSLEDIGRQHSLTRERVRQLTDPKYIAHKYNRRAGGLNDLAADLAQLEARKNELLMDAVDKLVAAYQACPATVQDEFLRKIGAAYCEDRNAVS